MGTVAVEFPGYPRESLPVIPAAFDQASWANDVCPSFWAPSLGLMVYVDYPDASAREFPNAPRFTLHRTEEEGAPIAGSDFSSDDWAAILRQMIRRIDDFAPHMPSAKLVEACAEMLGEAPEFQGAALAQAFADWSRDGAHIYEGGREPAIEEALAALLPTIEEESDPEGWRRWSQIHLIEASLLLLVGGEVAKRSASYTYRRDA